MAWWSWIIGGAILFGAELALVSADFYLVFVGSAAMIVGVLAAITPIPAWAQWALFAVLLVVLMLGFRSRVYQRFHRTLPKVATGPVGSVLTLPVSLAAGETCQTDYRGTTWTVRNGSADPIAAGARAHVVGVRELTLVIEPAP